MARPLQDLYPAGSQGRSPGAVDRDERQLQQSIVLAKVRSELDTILDAIRLIDGDPLNSEIIQEIRNGSSYQAVLTTASCIVRAKGGC